MRNSSGVAREASDTIEEVRVHARALEDEGRLGLTRSFIQHGSESVYAHVLSVALLSASIADRCRRIGIRIDRSSLIRGALLHDYFLYDWHDPDPDHRLHGFRHPYIALERATEDFDLTDCERDIIVHHMFPLVPLPPTCREAWIVCIADKCCAIRETVAGRLSSRVSGVIRGRRT
ncbi:metal dependent phosphohydrolase [Coriobacterium glomerans PW2]|uniref:Metal dependent phosphohydrolase n=1 Tax=Coriobacterium glomerans (strain ATCC 49209 / DSM 20642 / JCM 10262 / PW2) TaxID=700015 RepID=F2N736_CORGP|nr:HD domain-containing protein [Coriobacterium glomerans]AEB06375.1 metal dependent phosphohydrolase [Coriobacterium glomerans PW2]